MYSIARSRELFEESCNYLAGGLGSNARMAVEPHPIFVTHGEGSKFYDVDGNQYIDYALGLGPLILGHCPRPVIEAVRAQLERGSHFGAPHELEIKVSKRLTELVPSLELVRYNQSGTEAVQAALRVARAYTGKNKIIKFEGHYHGWADNLYVSYAPPSLEAMGPADAPHKFLHSAGQVESVLEDLIVLPWNNLDLVEKTINAYKDEIAAVLTEPIMCNASVILPKPGYLEGLRQVTADNEILFIFDEVITGFRVGLSGAQGYLGISPDLSVFAKAMAAGYPASCFGGKREIMELIAAEKVAHAGTYNTNPLVLAAVDATLSELAREDGAVYRHIGRLAARLRHGLQEIFQRAGLGVQIQGPETIFSMMFTDHEITNFRDAFQADAERLMRFRKELRLRGVYTKPSPRDIWYISAAHTDEDIDRTLEVVAEVVPLIK